MKKLISRPWQVLGLWAIALALGVVVYAATPDGRANLNLAAYKLWVISAGAAIGLVVDMVVFYYARPGAFRGDMHKEFWAMLMQRRAVIIVGLAIAAGLAL